MGAVRIIFFVIPIIFIILDFAIVIIIRILILIKSLSSLSHPYNFHRHNVTIMILLIIIITIDTININNHQLLQRSPPLLQHWSNILLFLLIMILMMIMMIMMLIMIIMIMLLMMKLTSIMGPMVGEAQPVGVGVLPGELVESIVPLQEEVKLLPGEPVESSTTRSIGSTITLPRLSLSTGSRMTEETVEL